MSENEQVHEDPTTGARKAFNLQMIGLIPVKFILGLGRHYGVGSKKYDKNNWRKGYDWEYSYNSAQRHLLAFWDGEDYDICKCTPAKTTDAELPCGDCGATGSAHVIAAAWHCAALHTFMEEHPELDSRWSTLKKPKLTISPLIQPGGGGFIGGPGSPGTSWTTNKYGEQQLEFDFDVDSSLKGG